MSSESLQDQGKSEALEETESLPRRQFLLRTSRVGAKICALAGTASFIEALAEVTPDSKERPRPPQQPPKWKLKSRTHNPPCMHLLTMQEIRFYTRFAILKKLQFSGHLPKVLRSFMSQVLPDRSCKSAIWRLEISGIRISSPMNRLTGADSRRQKQVLCSSRLPSQKNGHFDCYPQCSGSLSKK